MRATRTATLHDADTTGLRAALWGAALLLALGIALAALGWGACGTLALAAAVLAPVAPRL